MYCYYKTFCQLQFYAFSSQKVDSVLSGFCELFTLKRASHSNYKWFVPQKISHSNSKCFVPQNSSDSNFK